MGTTFARKGDVNKKWHVVDAEGQVLGRLASQLTLVLTGKDKPTYTPFLDTGDHVIVVNAEKVILTGKKEQHKLYVRHTGYPGGIRTKRAEELRSKRPEHLIESAIRGMLPKTKLGRAYFKKLKVYRGPHHPHQAQEPEELKLVAG